MAVFDFLKKKEPSQQSVPKVKRPDQPQLILWDEEGTKYEYFKNEVVLGRHSTACDLTVNGTHVSRIHLRFLYENEKWYVEDMHSTAGTWHNGDKLLPLQKIELREGDRINLALCKSFYFMKKTEKKAYGEKKDTLGYLVCEYHLAIDQGERMKKISALLAYLQENSVWVSCTAVYSEEDAQKFLNAKKGDQITLEGAMRMRPDILKDRAGTLHFPVFSSKEEAPEEYRNRFSWMNIPFVQCCKMTKGHAECNEIIINAFTNSLPITDELINIILNHAK